jgi:3-dehydroquinate dehydratase-2
MPKLIFILNGPNLNLLGQREPEIYGRDTLDDIRLACEQRAKALNLTIDFRQSNREHDLVDWIQEARARAHGLIVNAAAYSHTSLAILDALQTYPKPAIEVHLSNIFRREEFRRHSYVSLGVHGVICGLGGKGYLLALDALAGLVE